MFQHKQITEREALSKLMTLCSKAEHCSGEMIDKMRQWHIADDAQARVMQFLTDKQFIDDERYCRAFVRDKVTYSKWGRRKIEQALWAKHISADVYNPILDEVPDEDYLAILRPLILSKQRTIKANSDYEASMKVIKYAMSRGFDLSLIKRCIGDIDVEEM